jgi:hypothetical protein
MSPFLSLIFCTVLRCFDLRVEGPNSAAGYSTSCPLAVALEYCAPVASRALDGGAGVSLVGKGVGTGGVRRMVGGAGGCLDACLLGWEGGMVLPLPFSSPAVLLAPLEIGHWCCFAALHDANLRPHALHCHCGRPASASSEAFWRSHLNARFLFCASRRFSFWAWIAILAPFVRSKKDCGPSPLSSSKIYTNITLFTL